MEQMAAGDPAITFTFQAGDGQEGLIILLAGAPSSKQPSQKSLPDLEHTFHCPEIDHKAASNSREAGKHALWGSRGQGALLPGIRPVFCGLERTGVGHWMDPAVTAPLGYPKRI